MPYIVDIFRNRTKPERATWWIWSSLSSVAFLAQLSSGATWSLGMTVGQIISVFIVAFLSVKYGYGSFRKKDFISLIIAGLGVILWSLTDEPLIALVVVILIDTLALILTMVKTWKSPESETLVTWVSTVFGGALGILAVGGIDLNILIYPVYILIGNAALSSLIIYRRIKLTTAIK